ncbi:apurinic/apyrimidinic endonuclease-redox protein [Leishmania tarentolae]|uniref:DNA-(apurinic or apyrimidinic site) endonuclease n=1 Tax=Leishmania tarentolae TaxID=5689 RepID=A0A640KEA8_LEITA|nr:apurinic/apyrimidinic endonuclease-redox protein [Leishmania tarentolae]
MSTSHCVSLTVSIPHLFTVARRRCSMCTRCICNLCSALLFLSFFCTTTRLRPSPSPWCEARAVLLPCLHHLVRSAHSLRSRVCRSSTPAVASSLLHAHPCCCVRLAYPYTYRSTPLLPHCRQLSTMASKRRRQSSSDSTSSSTSSLAPSDLPPLKRAHDQGAEAGVAVVPTAKVDTSATVTAAGDSKKKTTARSPARRTSSAPKITNGDVGKLIRTAEALAALNTKKSEKEIWADVVPFVRTTSDSEFNSANMYKFITWNVAGLRGLLKKNPSALTLFMEAEQPDILCLQETKLNVDEADANASLGVVDGYSFVDHPCAFKRGYSGTRTYMKNRTTVKELHARCTRGFVLPSESQTDAAADSPVLVEGAGDEEGRVLTTFLFSDPNSASSSSSRIALVNTYVANSGMGLTRLPYRIQSFDTSMRDYLHQLDTWATAHAAASSAAAGTGSGSSPHGFIWAGDLNVAERDYDRYYAGTFKSMQECSGFSPEERMSFRETMQRTNSVDVFRQLYPKAGPVYSFWSQRINGRARNLGWRLDYFVVSSRLASYVVDCFPMPTVMGSDHCPFQMWMRHP